MKLGAQTHLSAESQSEGTIQFVPKPWKLVILIPRRRRGTWEGVPVATSCSEWICRMRGGLAHHTIIIPPALSLPLLRGAAVGRAPTIFQIDLFCTRISNFFQSPICSIVEYTLIQKHPLQNNIHVSKVHCGSAVPFGQALLGFLITAHHLWPFLLYLKCQLCGGVTTKKKTWRSNLQVSVLHGLFKFPPSLEGFRDPVPLLPASYCACTS